LLSWVLFHKLGPYTFLLRLRRADGGDPFFMDWRYTRCWNAQKDVMRKKRDTYGSFLMFNGCATILEHLDTFAHHALWHDTVPLVYWYPSMHFGTWYNFNP
jgi:hypothetical protein